jgi:hypothetical protein
MVRDTSRGPDAIQIADQHGVGRIYCTGPPADYKAVHGPQEQISLVPLSAYGKPYTPPAGTVDPNVDVKTAVRKQVNELDAATYFG